MEMAIVVYKASVTPMDYGNDRFDAKHATARWEISWRNKPRMSRQKGNCLLANPLDLEAIAEVRLLKTPGD
jgi:hypothetical protein